MDEPNMSDTTILVTVEDLIYRVMGPPNENVINFKLLETVLLILARQQRTLEQRVEIRVREVEGKEPSLTSVKKSSPRKGKKRSLQREGDKAESDRSQERDSLKQKDKSKSDKSKAKQSVDRTASKDTGKAKRAISEERETKDKKNEEAEEKGSKRSSKSRSMERDMVDKTEERTAKKSEKAKRASSKEKKSEEKDKSTLSIEKKEIEREKEEQAVSKSQKLKRKHASESVIIKESERTSGEKVLVVEKGPTTRSEGRRGSSIEVVTRSQFALLESVVMEIQDNIGVAKPLRLPDNEKLKRDIKQGSATLLDTMQAMQVNARVKAAEEAIDRMTGILTHLATSGALPDDIAHKVEAVAKPLELAGKPVEKLKESRKSVVIESLSQKFASKTSDASDRLYDPLARHSVMSRTSTQTRPSIIAMMPGVTPDEMNEALRAMREELTKDMNRMIGRATSAAENALQSVKSMSEKFYEATEMGGRLSKLSSLIADYAEQLSGFDAGISTQMQSFNEQIVQMKGELESGLKQLENINTNVETVAVTELKERYAGLVTELDTTMLAHQDLSETQAHLGAEMQSLVECVEMLREEKCDRDEVLDGLRDKADSSRLSGLLTEAEFAATLADLDRRLEVCHDKFRRQDAIWMGALKDLSEMLDRKTDLVDLLSSKEETQKQLQDLHEKLKILASVLGEPKTAMMTRKLSVEGVCGSCGGVAQAAVTAGPGPPCLPPQPPQEPRVCLRDLIRDQPRERHMCHRWVGGSHTLLPPGPPHRAAGLLPEEHTNKYSGYGDDGRLYMMEEECQPCVECNEPPSDKVGDVAPAPGPAAIGAGGDRDEGECTCDFCENWYSTYIVSMQPNIADWIDLLEIKTEVKFLM